MSLNSKKVVIVSETGQTWSQQYNASTRKLVPMHNITRTAIECNSNDTQEDVDAKNIMIMSEDSSEWSQDFVEKKHALSVVKTTITSPSDCHGKQETETTNDNNATVEDTNELSNSLQEQLDKNEDQAEFLDSNLLRCRTCLNVLDVKESIPLYNVEPSGETLKDLLIYLLPQMVSTVCDEDVVCKHCDTSIKFCVEFIDNCLKVETELVNEYEEDNELQYQEESEDVKKKQPGKKKARVPQDHDYMPEIKSEKDALMETEDSKMAETLLSNEDPTLASTEEYIFECFRCGMTFESENDMENHERSEHNILHENSNEGVKHEERIYYKCNFCEVLFATKHAYNVHVRTEHPEAEVESAKKGRYTCKQCGSRFLYLSDLYEHKSVVHGFLCNVCPERFNSKIELQVHMNTHPDLYFCEVCGKGFKTRRSLTSHVKIHETPDLYSCDECGVTFESPEELDSHAEELGHCVDRASRKFLCDLCDEGFVDRRGLRKHKQMHHDYMKEYLCSVCDKNFSSKTSLDSHYRLKHATVKPYQCERCGERFARLDYLRRHTNCTNSDQCKKFMKGPRRKFRYTKSDGEVRCKLCGKMFKDVYLLKLHLTTHTNLRRFRCSVCNLTFTTNKNRERHEKIHNDPLSKYRCTVCWKRTQSQEELDNHMQSHEKKYQCHLCHESFARVYLLNYHVSEVHADDEDVEKEKQIVFNEGLKEYLLDYP